MVEELFSTGSEEELSNLAQSQLKENASDDSQQIIKTLAVINYLKVTVLVIIGFILRKLVFHEQSSANIHSSSLTSCRILSLLVQQIYYRLFAKGTGQSRVNSARTYFGRKNQRAGQRPFTRAEALLVMLENNGCPPEQL